MAERLSNDFAGKNKAVSVNRMFTSHAADVITEYAFSKSYYLLDDVDFNSPFTVSVRGFKDIAHPCNQFYWLPRILASLPDWMVQTLQPSMAIVIEFQNVGDR